MIENIKIESTERTPEIDFNFEKGIFSVRKNPTRKT